MSTNVPVENSRKSSSEAAVVCCASAKRRFAASRSLSLGDEFVCFRSCRLAALALHCRKAHARLQLLILLGKAYLCQMEKRRGHAVGALIGLDVPIQSPELLEVLLASEMERDVDARTFPRCEPLSDPRPQASDEVSDGCCCVQ